MSKKKKIEITEEIKEDTISKKELYDLRKKEKEKRQEKNKKKNNKEKKHYQTSLIGRIFAFVMLILMVGSVIATISYYFR